MFPPKSSFLPKSFFLLSFLESNLFVSFLLIFIFLSCFCQFHYLFLLHFTYKLFLLNHSVIFHFLLCFNLCLFIPFLFSTLPIIYFSVSYPSLCSHLFSFQINFSLFFSPSPIHFLLPHFPTFIFSVFYISHFSINFLLCKKIPSCVHLVFFQFF